MRARVIFQLYDGRKTITTIYAYRVFFVAYTNAVRRVYVSFCRPARARALVCVGVLETLDRRNLSSASAGIRVQDDRIKTIMQP